MSSPNSSSPSTSPSSSDESAVQQATTQNGGRGTQQKKLLHSSSYGLRPRAMSAATSGEGRPEKHEGQRQHDPVETVENDDEQQWPTRGDERMYGRREIESDSSDYQPSNMSSSPEPGLQENQGGEDVKEATGDDDGDGDGDEDGDEGGDDDSASDGAAEYHRPSRKRSRQRAFSATSVGTAPQPVKRTKRSVNTHYLELLNDDMNDARRRYVPDVWPELETSQAGLTIWTAEEKEMLYESLSRLGGDDTQRIAARLGSKNEIEVRHYLHLLHEDAERRRFKLRAPLHKPLLSDFPAAAEISEACCSALEEAADKITQREGFREVKGEESKWGPHWLLTGDNCRDLSKAALEIAGMPADDEVSNQSPMPEGGVGQRLAELGAQLRPESVPTLTLFNIRTMLLLSERVFMNGVAEDANYMALGGLPAVRMSALQDLYNLVHSLTQRLAATAMHICRSRDQSKRSNPRAVKNVVRARDVQAAVASLGLKNDSQEFWARCPRRLGVNVSRSAVPFSDMDGTRKNEVVDKDAEERADLGGEDSATDGDVMTYDEVEKELLPGPVVAKVSQNVETDTKQQLRQLPYDVHNKRESNNGDDKDEDEDDDNSTNDDDGNVDDDDNDEESSSESQHAQSGDDTTDTTHQRIRDEADEIIRYTATGFPHAAWAHTSLKKRIRDELKEEAYACSVDAHESSRDELYLWTVLGQTPPASLGLDRFDENATPHVEGFSVAARRFPVEEVIETGSNWRDKLQYEAEWEEIAAQAQKRVEAANKRARALR